ncbi:alpha-galactosidase [Puteibacter caeruleilacunae]|nr:alpha-galactosidase [Puteibacter caeruleilacunae]
MRKRTIITVIVMCMAIGQLFAGNAVNQSLKSVKWEYGSAEMIDDTLVLKNDKVEVKYLWNEGDIILLSIKDLKSDYLVNMSAKKSGFAYPGVAAKVLKANIEGGVVVDAVGENDHIEVAVTTSYQNVDVKRTLKMYPGASACFMDYAMKGSVAKATGEKDDQVGHTGVEKPVKKSKITVSTMEQISLPGRNLKMKSAKFYGVTDNNNNLVDEREVISYHGISMKGNILTVQDPQSDLGIFIYKKAPLEEAYPDYPGYDFKISGQKISVAGIGIPAKMIKENEWTEGYGVAVGLAASNSDLDVLTALRNTKQAECNYIPEVNDMVLMNTWGDRSRDARMSEKFILAELDRCKELGITHFQLDDGWQAGLSHNSAFKGKEKAWAKWKMEDWLPHAERFPNGMEPIVAKGKRLGIEIGLWFNPSSHNDYEAWENDATILIGLYKRYGIRIFKIDGMMINNKQGEINFKKFYRKVIEGTDGEVIFNLDVTAGRRFGYNFLEANNNIFLENRYTDWGGYYPFRTLRNLWMLSRYIAPQNLQIEFLNKWRNANRYGKDPLGPNNVPFDYTFAITMMAQPLAWFEASGLPEEGLKVAPVIKAYNKHRNQIHSGVILPIGNTPDGMSWTGFQSVINEKEGYILVFREWNEYDNESLKTWFKNGDHVVLSKIVGQGEDRLTKTVGRNGVVEFTLPVKHSYALYKYHIK